MIAKLLRVGMRAFDRRDCLPSNCWKQHVPARARRLRQHLCGHLIHCVFLHALAALRAIGPAHAREQQAQEVVAFGRCGHRRARIAAGVFLANRNGRRDAIDLIDVRLLHPLQKLARVSRERFHVAPLALGVDSIEGERGLPGARHTRHHRQLVVRDGQRNVLQVMDPRPADLNGLFHARPYCLS